MINMLRAARRLANTFDMMRQHDKKSFCAPDISDTSIAAVMMTRCRPMLPCCTAYFRYCHYRAFAAVKRCHEVMKPARGSHVGALEEADGARCQQKQSAAAGRHQADDERK